VKSEKTQELAVMNQQENSHEVLQRLRGLHDELSSINEKLTGNEQVDEPTIDALGQLVTDVAEIIDNARRKQEVDPDCPDRNDLMQRVTKFESDHPRVTSFLAQVVDLLGMSGI
jgi:ribosome-binding protein aMBF1 (putative translation factor)